VVGRSAERHGTTDDGIERVTGKGLLAIVALAVALQAFPREALAQETPPAKDEPSTDKPAGDQPRPGSDDEIVEIVDDSAPSTKPGLTATPEPARSDKIELRGFARTTLGVGLPAEGGAPRVPLSEERVGYERATSVTQAYLDVRYTRARTFQAVLSGSLAYTAALIEGPAGSPLDARELRSVLVEPLLREAFLGFYSTRVDVRLGQQRIVWGNSDAFAPNDILNARDTRNRMQLDSEMVHIPTLAARADFDLGIAVLGLVAQPFFVPDRASIYGNNWSLVQPDAPLHVRKFFGTHGQGRDSQEIESGLARAKAAQMGFAGASVGASMRFHFGSVDASYYYHYGRDRSPFVYLDPEVANQLSTATSDQDYATIFASQQRASRSYGGPFVVESVRRHHVGMDLATTAGPFVLRFDAAFDTAMTFYTRQNLNSVARPTAQAVFGAEYQRGLGKVVIVEASYMKLLGPEIAVVPTPNQANDGPLLLVNEDNLGVANVIRWSFDNVVVEARSFLGVQPFSWVLRPEIGYGASSFTVRLGYLAIDGAGGSFGSYFRRNETVYITSRYSF
jgi:hypothetical protein